MDPFLERQQPARWTTLDRGYVVVYFKEAVLRSTDYARRFYDDCYEMTYSQYKSLVQKYGTLIPRIYALHVSILDSKRMYYHPAKVREMVDPHVGYREVPLKQSQSMDIVRSHGALPILLLPMNT